MIFPCSPAFPNSLLPRAAQISRVVCWLLESLLKCGMTETTSPAPNVAGAGCARGAQRTLMIGQTSE